MSHLTMRLVRYSRGKRDLGSRHMTQVIVKNIVVFPQYWSSFTFNFDFRYTF